MLRILASWLALGMLMTAPLSEARASPAEEARIVAAVRAVAAYADNGDFAALERVFAPETLVDYTSLWGGEPQRFTPQALMAAWAGLLPGFDATRHDVGDIAVTLDGERAEVAARVTATHWIGARSWTVRGAYAFELLRSAGRWQVSRMTFRLAEESGERALVQEAAAIAARGK